VASSRANARAALKISEDTLIGLCAMARGRRIFHPTPTIIDHDLSIKSTYGNDVHRHRRPYATWHDFDRSTLDCDASKAVHLGRFYLSNHWLCRQYVYDWTPENTGLPSSIRASAVRGGVMIAFVTRSETRRHPRDSARPYRVDLAP